jgi:hypothetical protein
MKIFLLQPVFKNPYPHSIGAWIGIQKKHNGQKLREKQTSTVDIVTKHTTYLNY